MKHISGNTAIKSSNLISKLEFVDNESLSPTDIANQINKTFLEPMNEYSPLEAEVPSPIPCPSSTNPLSVSVLSTFNKLKSLNPGKSPGPDIIPNWVFKEYAELLAEPVSIILNSSYQEQKLPPDWKCANVTPVSNH